METLALWLQSLGTELWVKLLSLVVAVVAAAYAIKQYKRNMRWKAHDTAAAELEKLTSDSEIALACQALDWGVGPLIVPEKYRALFRHASAPDSSAVMDHDPELLCESMRTKLTQRVLDDPRGLVYRYCFIRFFEYLNAIARQIQNKQILAADVEDLKYWLHYLQDYPYTPSTYSSKQVFAGALHDWEYTHLLKLAENWGIEFSKTRSA